MTSYCKAVRGKQIEWLRVEGVPSAGRVGGRCEVRLQTRPEPWSTKKAVCAACPACASRDFISHKLSINSFGQSRFPHKFVNVSCFDTNMKNRSTDLCGNCLLQDGFINTFCEIRLVGQGWGKLLRSSIAIHAAASSLSPLEPLPVQLSQDLSVLTSSMCLKL